MQAIFSDFDETISTCDMFDVIIDGLGKGDELRTVRSAATVRERRELQARLVNCSLEEADRILARDLELDASFPPFARLCRSLQVPLTILSTGIAALERRALQRLSIGWVPIEANDAVPSSRAWRMIFRDESPDGLAKRSYIEARSCEGYETVMIGDGASDFAAARAADRCFAKRGSALEVYLADGDREYVPFETFADVARIIARWNG